MSDIFSEISILLVFATVALDFFIKDSYSFIKKGPPDLSKNTDVKIYNTERNIISIKLFAVFFFYAILFWLLLPKSIEIITKSHLDLWDFNILSTFYILINLCIVPFIILTIKSLINILKL
ncbi:MAG: hypothetical protein WCJ95_20310 [Mariniphaga sp.]